MSRAKFSVHSLQFIRSVARELLQQNIADCPDDRRFSLSLAQVVQKFQMDFGQLAEAWKHTMQIRAQLEVLLQTIHENLRSHE